MLKNFKPTIIVAGDPNSIFYEIFFKTFKKIKLKNPIILITCKRKFFKEAKIFKFIKKINIIDLEKTDFIYEKSTINLIDI